MDDWTPAETTSAPFPPLPEPKSPPPRVTPMLRMPAPPPPAGFSVALPGGAVSGRPGWKPLDIPPDISPLGLHVGTGGYHFQDWAGRFYPGASAREWFPFYQLYFSFLELNHTFHQEPLVQHFVELERCSKQGMMFSVKVHRDISHKGTWDPREGRSLMRKHAAAVGPLAETGRFYSFLIQLDERVERGCKVLDYLLETASAAVSEGLDVHVEFRNRTWHQEAVLQSLKDAGVGICNTDIPGLPHAFPLKTYATTRKAYVRYCGLNLAGWQASGDGTQRLQARNDRYDYRYSLAELEERVRGQILLLEKTGEVAAVFKNHVGANAALNAVQNIHLLLKHRL
ncbi:MAG: hypothetical protein JWO30_2507 [Fibrobacteres bacterium]|nr:hypothetical protein [Fibrobacterota bacterium]